MTSPAAVPVLHRAMLAHLNEAFDSPECYLDFWARSHRARVKAAATWQEGKITQKTQMRNNTATWRLWVLVV
jgi:hypothetical protein